MPLAPEYSGHACEQFIKVGLKFILNDNVATILTLMSNSFENAALSFVCRSQSCFLPFEMAPAPSRSRRRTPESHAFYESLVIYGDFPT
jgi:hypothetical protein